MAHKNVGYGVLILILIAIGYLYTQRYVGCILKDILLCINSNKYVSATGKFVFRYPKDYPLTFKTGEQLVEQYHFDDTYGEWVNFSNKFYPNAGGDRLGSVIVDKNVPYKNVKDYAEKELNNLEIPPVINYVKIGGKDAVCSSLQQQPHSFNSPSYDCFVIHGSELYRISFDYNEYYHKQSIQYYEKGREIILSTFAFE